MASIGTGAGSLFIGLIGCCLPCVGFLVYPLSLAAIGTGVFSLMRQKKEPEKFGGKGLAMGGIGLGAAWLVLYVIYTILMMSGVLGSSIADIIN